MLSNSPKLLILFRPEMTLPPRRPMRIAGNMKRVPLSQDSVVKVTYIQVQGYKVNIHCHAQGIGARGRAVGLNGTRGQSPCSRGSLCSGALAFSFVLVLAATREDRLPRTGQRKLDDSQGHLSLRTRPPYALTGAPARSRQRSAFAGACPLRRR